MGQIYPELRGRQVDQIEEYADDKQQRAAVPSANP